MDWTSGRNGPLSTFPLDEHWDILLDPDCVFWALAARGDESVLTEARDLHRQVAEDLDDRLRRFRFETHVTALYVNPNDACHADCRYCYIPPEVRRRGSRMDRQQLQAVLEKAALYFSRQDMAGRKPVIIFHGGEP
ncbi:MAG: peptide-modifying radical SAM enzyme CbpB, partial [Dehalococcoidia bacterium]|nr:peptide-modifying radical SAM enzyme CbpB [Dehalococcoidia bacterium]